VFAVYDDNSFCFEVYQLGCSLVCGLISILRALLTNDNEASGYDNMKEALS